MGGPAPADCQSTGAGRFLDEVEREGLSSRQKATLEVGFYTVLLALIFGVSLGDWPGWAAVAALLSYLLWVIAYSEATVRVTLHDRRVRRPAASD
jgi:hypothetical protein